MQYLTFFIRRTLFIVAFIVAAISVNIWQLATRETTDQSASVDSSTQSVVTTVAEETPTEEDAQAEEAATEAKETEATKEGETTAEAETTTTEAAADLSFQTVDDTYFDDALFIGDSRSEGLGLYGSLQNADYFTSVGLSVFKVLDGDTAGNPNSTEEVTLAQKLSSKTYGKVYIMLGLNELAIGSVADWASSYQQIIDQVRAAQPNAIIYIQGILHVDATNDDPSTGISNASINEHNAALEALANPDNMVFYLDINPSISDANGCLQSDLTSDGIHLLGNSLSLWEDVLRNNAIVLDSGTTTDTAA